MEFNATAKPPAMQRGGRQLPGRKEISVNAPLFLRVSDTHYALAAMQEFDAFSMLNALTSL